MFIIKMMIGLVFFILVGCSSPPDIKETDSEVIVDVKVPEPSPVKETLTEISPEVMYLLMTAEIAGQRNQYGIALEGYLQAAKQVDDVRVVEKATKIGLYLKDTKKTDEAVSLWLKKDSGNLTARKIAVLSALKGDDKGVAVDHLSKMLEDDPAGLESTLLELIQVLGEDGRNDFVFDVLEGVAVLHQKQPAIYFVQALLAGRLNKEAVVKEKVDKALALQPTWDKALLLRAQLFVQKGKIKEAREDLERILEKTPENNKIRKMYAKTLVKVEALDEAVAAYQKVLVIAPDDGESQFSIALIYLQQEKEGEALVYLKKLVNKPGWDDKASFYIGRIEYSHEHYGTALVWFDKVTQGPYEFEASMSAVSVFVSQKDFLEALQRLDKVLIKFPKRELSIVLLKADIYSEQKKNQEAFDLLTEQLVNFPEHRDLLYTRALIAEKVDRLDILELDLKKILLKKPNDVAALNALGYTLVDRTGRYNDAAEYLERALKLKPGEAVIIDSMGWLQFKRGRVNEALALLRTAYEKQQENEIAIHLAEVLWVLGQRSEAKEIFNEALKKAPDDEYLLKFQQRFPYFNK